MKHVILTVKADGKETHLPDLDFKVGYGDTVYVVDDRLKDQYSKLLQESVDVLTWLKKVMVSTYSHIEIRRAQAQIDTEAMALAREFNNTPGDDEFLLAYLLPGEYRKRMEMIKRDKDEILNKSEVIKVENTTAA